MTTFDLKLGEVTLDFDPASADKDAGVVFIGKIKSPWNTRSECPKNMRLARERGQAASIKLNDVYKAGLSDLDAISHVVILVWLNEARRDIIVKQPSHSEGATRGVFSLRSPNRPNPIGVSIAKITGIDVERGIINIEATDFLNGTPVIDIKPYLPSVDAIVDADPGWHS